MRELIIKKRKKEKIKLAAQNIRLDFIHSVYDVISDVLFFFKRMLIGVFNMMSGIVDLILTAVIVVTLVNEFFVDKFFTGMIVININNLTVDVLSFTGICALICVAIVLNMITKLLDKVYI